MGINQPPATTSSKDQVPELVAGEPRVPPGITWGIPSGTIGKKRVGLMGIFAGNLGLSSKLGGSCSFFLEPIGMLVSVYVPMCDCAVWLCPQDLVIAATKLRHFEAKRMNSVGDLLKFEHCTRPTIWRKQPQMEHSLEMLLNGTSWLYCMFCCNRKVCASQIFVCPGTWCQICRSVLTCFASLGVGDDGQWSGHGVRRFTRDFDQKCPCRSTIQKWQDVTRCDKYHLADLAQDEVRTAPTASFHVQGCEDMHADLPGPQVWGGHVYETNLSSICYFDILLQYVTIHFKYFNALLHFDFSKIDI